MFIERIRDTTFIESNSPTQLKKLTIFHAQSKVNMVSDFGAL
jgi:hypothetical protein